MKSHIVSVVVAALCSTAAAFAEEAPFQAAVVAKETNAELMQPNSSKAEGRKNLEVGVVYEVGATTRDTAELKIDGKLVAIVPTASLRIRACTPGELSTAQAKFNV